MSSRPFASSLALACATAGLVFLLPAIGHAEIITFGLSTIDPLIGAGIQTEGNFTYEAIVGQGWEVNQFPGNPGAALVTFFNIENSQVNDIVNIAQVGGGDFTFTSVDTNSFDSNEQVTLTGFLNGTPVGSFLIIPPTTTYQTVLSTFTSPIDLLEIRITSTGNGALFLDNFNVTPALVAVPEPGTFALLGIGVLPLAGMLARRRKS